MFIIIRPDLKFLVLKTVEFKNKPGFMTDERLFSLLRQ
jgi:hypothetical protein